MLFGINGDTLYFPTEGAVLFLPRNSPYSKDVLMLHPSSHEGIEIVPFSKIILLEGEKHFRVKEKTNSNLGLCRRKSRRWTFAERLVLPG